MSLNILKILHFLRVLFQISRFSFSKFHDLTNVNSLLFNFVLIPLEMRPSLISRHYFHTFQAEGMSPVNFFMFHYFKEKWIVIEGALI